MANRRAFFPLVIIFTVLLLLLWLAASGRVNGRSLQPVPFAGNGGWTESVLAGIGEWTYGLPAAGNSFFGGCNGGSLGCWGTDLTGDYENDTQQLLFSTPINIPLTATTPITVTWAQAYVTESGFDYASAYHRCNGGSWQIMGSLFDGVGYGGGWGSETFGTTCNAGETLELYFLMESDGSFTDDGYFVDDVVVTDAAANTLYREDFEPFANDVGVTSVAAPNSNACGFGIAEQVAVAITNFGTASQSNFDLTLTVTGPVNSGPLVETYTGPTIGFGASEVYTFTNTIDLSVAGTYTLTISTSLPGDSQPANDSFPTTIDHINTISTFPYVESFESGSGGWISGGSNSSWDLAAPGGNVINSAADGSLAWVTNATGNYNGNEQSHVTSPCFDLSGIANPQIDLSVWWESEPGFDGASLQYSTDAGQTWSTLGAAGDPNNWYTDNNIFGMSWLNSNDGWSGNNDSGNGSSGWLTASHALTQTVAATQYRLRVAFGADDIIQDDGFAFDAVHITDGTSPPSCAANVYPTVGDPDVIISNDLSWLANGGNPTGFRLFFGSDGGGVTPPTNFENGTDLGYATDYGPITNTLYSTTYYWQVVPYNANGSATGCPIWSFTTESDPTIVSFPWRESFENGGSLPRGWVNQSGDGGEDWLFDVPGNGTDPANYGADFDHTSSHGYIAWIDDSSPHASPTNLLSPPLDLTGVLTPELTFWVWNSQGNSNLSVLYLDVYDGAAWHTAVYTVNTMLTAWTEIGPIDLSAYKSGSTQLRFRADESGGFRSDLSLDDVTITDAPTTPLLDVLPGNHNFGQFNTCQTSYDQTFTITNAGTGTLTVDSVSLSGPGAGQFILTDPNSYPVGLTGGTISVTVNYSTTLVGSAAATLTITHSQGVDSYLLSANAVEVNYGASSAATGNYQFMNSTLCGQMGGATLNPPSFLNYGWIVETSNMVDVTNPDVGNPDDGYWGPLPIGFNFPFFGNSYTELYVSSNGLITFGSGSTDIGYGSIPLNNMPNNFVAVAWRDSEIISGTSNIYYGGNAARFVVTFEFLTSTGESGGGDELTAQAIFYADGEIRLQYNDTLSSPLPPTDFTQDSVVGIENSTGTAGIEYLFAGSGGPIFGSPMAVSFAPNGTPTAVSLRAGSVRTHTSGLWLALLLLALSLLGFWGYLIMRRQEDR